MDELDEIDKVDENIERNIKGGTKYKEKEYVCMLCREKVKQSKMVMVGKSRYHSECAEQKLVLIKKKELEDAIKDKNQAELLSLENYIIRRYFDGKSLNGAMVMKLQAIRSGRKHTSRGDIAIRGDNNKGYRYKMIHLCFELNKNTINSAIHGKLFKSNNHKFNYICAIVESELENVKDRLKQMKKDSLKLTKINEIAEYKYVEYQKENHKKTVNENNRSKFDGLW